MLAKHVQRLELVVAVIGIKDTLRFLVQLGLESCTRFVHIGEVQMLEGRLIRSVLCLHAVELFVERASQARDSAFVDLLDC